MSKKYTLQATVVCKSGTSRRSTLSTCTSNYTSNTIFGGTGTSNQYACILAFGVSTIEALRALPSTAFKSILLTIKATTAANAAFTTYYGPKVVTGTASAEISSSTTLAIAKGTSELKLDLLSIGIPKTSNAYCIGCQTSSYGTMRGITATLEVETYEDCYKISYSANGGSNAPEPTYSTISGTSTVTITTSEPTREWYNFACWSTRSDRVSPVYDGGDSYTLTGDITLYAVWVESAQIRYKLTNTSHLYNYSSSPTNNGVSGSSSRWGYYYSSSVQYYYMHAWLFDQSELENIKTKITNGATLDAIRCAWTRTSERNQSYATRYIAWKTNGSTTSTAAGSRVSTGYINSNDSDFHVASFDGFNNYEDIPVSAGIPTYGVCFRPNSTTQTRPCLFEIDVSAGIGLYFTLTEPRLTLSFNANGGSGAPILDKHRTTTGSSSFVIPSYEPIKAGETFLGWSTNQSSSIGEYQPGSTITIESDTTLYAIWKGSSTYDAYYKHGGEIYGGEIWIKMNGEMFRAEPWYKHGGQIYKGE